MKIEGEAKYVDAQGKRYSIEGIGSLPDATALQSLNVSGSLDFGEIFCDKIKIEGECFGKSITAKNISVSGSFEVDAVKVEETFKVEGSVDSDNISAAEIVMETRGGKIGNVNCNKIKIFHGESCDIGGSILSNIFGRKVFQNNSRVQIKTIDAEKVDLQNCEVEEIHCQDAVINSNCVIEKLIVKGECKVAADSKIGETIRA